MTGTPRLFHRASWLDWAILLVAGLSIVNAALFALTAHYGQALDSIYYALTAGLFVHFWQEAREHRAAIDRIVEASKPVVVNNAVTVNWAEAAKAVERHLNRTQAWRTLQR